MSALPPAVLDRIPHLPESPGVYLWKDADGNVLYVGKAKRLRSRVRSYANLDRIESARTYALMKQVAAVETIVVPSGGLQTSSIVPPSPSPRQWPVVAALAIIPGIPPMLDKPVEALAHYIYRPLANRVGNPDLPAKKT